MIQFDVQSLNTVGEDITTTVPVTVGSGTPAHTKGSYSEIIASTPVAAHAIILQHGVTSAGGDYLVDIALGGAGSEVVLINNLLHTTTGALDQVEVLLPLAIPSGSRIAARCQCTTALQAIRVQLTLIQSLGVDVTAIETGGANTADSGGTSVDPGAVANTKGAWSQLIASTGTAYDWLLVAIGNQNNTARTSCVFLIDIGIGAAASEVVLIPDLSSRANPTPALRPTPYYFSLPVPRIAAGTRIAARMQCSITDATDRLVDVVVYGIAGQEAAAGGGMLVHPGYAGGLRG